jgi:hypothetical protein
LHRPLYSPRAGARVGAACSRRGALPKSTVDGEPTSLRRREARRRGGGARRNQECGARQGSARAPLRGGVVGGAARRARRRIARAGGPFVIDARLLKARPFDSGFVLPPSCAVPGSYSRPA